jgi:CRISPR-associated protein Cas2
MWVLITYDVRTDTKEGRRRLRKVAKTCEGHGARVQFSVFECQVDEATWTHLRGTLLSIIDTDQDSLRFYFLGEKWAARCEHHGIKPSADMEGPLLL